MPKPKTASYLENNEQNETHLQLDPIIEGLLDRLPAPGDVFPPAIRQLWLQILTLTFQLVYLDKEEEEPQE